MADRLLKLDPFGQRSEAIAYRSIRQLALAIMDLFHPQPEYELSNKTQLILKSAYRTLKKTAIYYHTEQPALECYSPTRGIPYRKNAASVKGEFNGK